MMTFPKEGINVLSLFDGISCGQVALERAGIKVNKYFASEVDKHAIKVTYKNYPDTIQLGDVREIQGKDLPKIDLLIGGSPCQGFSFAGKQLNFDDPRSQLFFEYVRLKEECCPRWFLLENVNMKKEWLKVIDEKLGVVGIKINSALVSAQNRVRWYWSNIDFDIPEDKGILLKDIIGKYDGVYVVPRGTNKGGIKEYKGKSPCITTSAWQHNFFIVNTDDEYVDRDKSHCIDASYFKGGNLNQYFNKSRRQLVFDKYGCSFRKFYVKECEALQTLPIGYTEGISDSQAYKAIGNGWTVDVVAHIFSKLKEKLNAKMD